MNKKNAKTNNKKTSYKALYNTLFLSLAVIIPQVLIYILGTKDLQNILIKPMWLVFILTYGIGVLVINANLLLCKFKVLTLRSINFTIPIIMLFWFMISTAYIDKFPLYGRLIGAVIVTVVFSLITNIIIGKMEDKLIEQNTKKPIK
ncbi:MAG3450 family membrane protein [Mycoplasmopsis iners]|uniref:MAG3450 family membrane protein n=1 Tax=Mycoplasmopsis iners TaxID=76630 RepID=UPI0004975E61|nr:hypothetical protein [Mycoplasmopsis iners]